MQREALCLPMRENSSVCSQLLILKFELSVQSKVLALLNPSNGFALESYVFDRREGM